MANFGGYIMKKLLFICVLLTAFSCKPADIDQISQGKEQITLISNGAEFRISKEVALKFSQVIQDMSEVTKDMSEFPPEPKQGTSISFGSDFFKPKILKLMFNILEQANDMLIERPISMDGSYIQLAVQLVQPPHYVDINTLLELMACAIFLDLDERIKQAIALAIVYHIPHLVTCEQISELRQSDLMIPSLMLPYIAQQYYLMNDDSLINNDDDSLINNDDDSLMNYYAPEVYGPDVFIRYREEIGITIRDLLIHKKPFNFTYNGMDLHDGIELITLDLDRRYIRDLEGIADIPNIDRVSYLNLNNNQIQTIPDHLNLPQLRQLNLNNNPIQNIPDHLNLPKLSHLNLENNQIQAIPDLNLPMLMQLNLENNQIQTISANLNLPKLMQLNLKNNLIQAISANLNLPKLRLLNLKHNPIQDIPANLTPMLI